MYVYALLLASGVTDGAVYPHDGLDAVRELEHHVSPAPPSQADPEIPAVLQTRSSIVSESESEAVVLHVTVAPGLTGPLLLAAVNPDAWLTSNGVPESPDPWLLVEHAAADEFPSQTKAYQALDAESPARAVLLQLACDPLAVAVLVHHVVAPQVGAPPFVAVAELEEQIKR